MAYSATAHDVSRNCWRNCNSLFVRHNAVPGTASTARVARCDVRWADTRHWPAAARGCGQSAGDVQQIGDSVCKRHPFCRSLCCQPAYGAGGAEEAVGCARDCAFPCNLRARRSHQSTASVWWRPQCVPVPAAGLLCPAWETRSQRAERVLYLPSALCCHHCFIHALYSHDTVLSLQFCCTAHQCNNTRVHSIHQTSPATTPSTTPLSRSLHFLSFPTTRRVVSITHVLSHHYAPAAGHTLLRQPPQRRRCGATAAALSPACGSARKPLIPNARV